MDIYKQTGREAQPCTPGADDLKLIHRLTRRPLPAEELYVFRAALCDNEIDRDGERFPVESLEALAKRFTGKTGLFDHSMRASDQLMRVYDTELRTDPARKTSLGEAYTSLVGKIYMLRSESTAELCRQIDAGIKKEVSVSCAVKAVRCSACGKVFGREGCTHRKGEIVDGIPCHARLEEPTDAYEFSFVAVPAQPGAGVIKAWQAKQIPKERRIQSMEDLRKLFDAAGGEAITMDDATAKALQAELEQLETLAADGRAYRSNLLAKAQRTALVALPGLAEDLLARMCNNLSTGELEDVTLALEKQAGKIIPLRPQLCRPADPPAAENADFRLN
ncbi:MAG: hypothetical protein LBS96_01710 [Oscillospiraceae bacterium]|nr:hypothetical protein [Oscillospiraceae bacterium]